MVDQRFSAYTVRVKRFSGKVDDLIAYPILTCDDETFVAAAECVVYRKRSAKNVTFILKIRGLPL